MVTQQQADKIAERLYDLKGVIFVSDRAAHAIAEVVGERDISDSDLFEAAKNSDFFIDFEDGTFSID